MLLAFSLVDYTVLGFYLAVMMLIGVYFNRQQHSTKDFFLAGRSMAALPVGLSIMATLLSALSYTGIPSESYSAGFMLLIEPLAVWLCVPVMLLVVLPLYHGLGVYSIYEYLELRFNQTTRLVASLLFIVWRLLWLGGVLYAPCKALVVAAGLEIPTAALIVILGLITTVYTFLGGMKAVIWTDVIQALVMVGGAVLIIGTVWSQLDGGAGQVLETAGEMGRSAAADFRFDLASRWSFWGALPHWVLAFLSFYIADQITAQRFLTTRSLSDARRSFVFNAAVFTILVPLLTYTGVAMLAFYQDRQHASKELDARWVVNVYDEGDKSDGPSPAVVHDPKTGKPLIDWDEEVTGESLPELVRQGRVVDPNRSAPPERIVTFDDTSRLTDRQGEPVVDRLATRYPPTKEVLINPRAKDELMPRFIERHLPIGLAGLILAALLAASMSSMDSGLNSITTLLVVDFHRRLGIGRQWLARRRGKRVDDLDEADELALGRPMVVVLGVAATLFSLAVAQIEDIFTIMVKVINTFGGPLLGLFLLGMLTRRTTSASALIALGTNMLLALWLTYGQAMGLWPWESELNSIWPVTFSVVGTVVIGYLLGLVIGRRKDEDELRGLVMGAGTLGEVEPPEADVVIDTDRLDDIEPPPPPWQR